MIKKILKGIGILLLVAGYTFSVFIVGLKVGYEEGTIRTKMEVIQRLSAICEREGMILRHRNNVWDCILRGKL